MAGQRWMLEAERIKDFQKMLDEQVDRVFAGRYRLVGQAVTLEIYRYRAESRVGESRHVAPEDEGGASPPVDEQHGR
jgi:hypothetical protein